MNNDTYLLKGKRGDVSLRYRSVHANPRNRLHGSADRQLTPLELTHLRELSRELERDNLIVSAAFDRIEDLVVGDGVKLQIQAGDDKTEKIIEELWEEWWESSADHTRRALGFKLDRLLLRTYLRDGDLALYKRESDGELLPIEGDRIESPTTLGKEWISGIRCTKSGRMTAINVKNEDDRSNVHISAKRLLFWARRERFSQTRGLPILSCAIPHFDDVDSFVEACIIGARTSIAHVIAITKEPTLEGGGKVNPYRDLESGGLLELNPGEKAQVLGSTQQMAEFSPFMTKMMRIAGLKLALSLEILSMDFSEANFSSARASIQVVKRAMNNHHKDMLQNIFKPLLAWKIGHWTNDGVVPSDLRYKATSLPPKEIQVDPLKEAMANKLLAGSFSTHRDVCLSYGRDQDEVLAQRQAEIKKAEDIAEDIRRETGIKDLTWRDIIGQDTSADENFFKYINGDDDNERKAA